MDRFLIDGGRPLRGEVHVSGSKNAALPQMVACLLADGASTLRNVPDLKDVETLGGVIESLGAKVVRDGDRLRIDAAGFSRSEASYDLVRKMRASVYVLGPMLARLGQARVSLPGGCAIGARPIDLHLRGFEALGAKIAIEGGDVVADARNLKGAEMTLEGPHGSSVGATINVLMAAVLTPGRTVIRGAAIEPDVSEVARMMNLMGARIRGIDRPTLEIEGVEKLRPIVYSTIPDRIEAGTFLLAAAITGGDVMVRGARADHLNALLDKMIQAGCEIEVLPDGVRAARPGRLRPTSIHTLPYPGFPTDLQAQFMTLMTMADGESLVVEGIYPERFIHCAELMRMGANIEMGRGGEARVKGVERLTAAPVMASDLRASAALVLAGLAAEKGTTEILRVYHIDRGYERIDAKLKGLGANIWRERETSGKLGVVKTPPPDSTQGA
jgi:UDP-N-acetylglucosamine 1-carboxyvinyltransferase